MFEIKYSSGPPYLLYPKVNFLTPPPLDKSNVGFDLGLFTNHIDGDEIRDVVVVDDGTARG